ncbi:MAG TPA: histidine--tRNA ligase, partial [Alphaproteobacteria bacterium]|nr:histidine--tRNA ligase [Alphaproteobacteria bacterium]
MSIIAPKTPTGTMELLPREQIAFQAMLDTIRAGYERHGFVPIETPVFEETNILLTKSGGDTEKQVYFVQSTGSLEQGHKPDLALRFDLTVPLARYVAEHEHELAFPFRRYQIQRVYRGERAQKGRFREFYQCDIDIIGKDTLSPAYDAEAPVVIADIFRKLQKRFNMGDFTIHVSNRKILNGLFENVYRFDDSLKSLVMREIDRADKIGWDKVKENLEKLNAGTAINLIMNLERWSNDEGENYFKSRHTLEMLKQMCEGSPLALEGVREIEMLLEATAYMGCETIILFNPTITRGLDYYTGTVYETFLNEHKNFGSICSGGRYDNLASHYTKSKLPGVGISIGATRLFEQMRQAGLVKEVPSTVRVLICRMDDALQPNLRKIANDLRG